MSIRQVTLMLASSAVVIAGAVVGAQSIRVGVLATEASASQPLIVREFFRATGQSVGTIEAGIVVGDDRWFAPILRLKPGVSVAAAQGALDLAVATATGRHPADGRPVRGVRLETLRR